MRAPQDVLLGRHALDGAEAGLVVPREMRVRLGHAGHQGRAAGIDHGDARHLDRARPTGHAGNAVALDEDFAGIWLSAAAVDDADVGEQHIGHVRPSNDESASPS